MNFRVLLASVSVVGEINEVALHWESFNLTHCSSNGGPVAAFLSLYNFVLFSVVWCSLAKFGVSWCSLVYSGLFWCKLV